jgi:transcription-repair coupling factor (superfamily II helicase)
VPSENLRLRTYKRIAAVTGEVERDELLREFEDRFGPPPQAVRNLLDYAVLKAVCEKLLVASVERRGAHVGIKFHDQTPVRPETVVRLLRRSSGQGLRLDPSGVLWMEWVHRGEPGNVTAAVQNVLLQLQS